MYNKDDKPIRKLLRSFLSELSEELDCSDLKKLNETLPLVGVRALFLFLVTVDPKLRYWAMQYETRGLRKPDPGKVCLFLKTLRNEIIPDWMSDERKNVASFVRTATELYIKC